MYYVLSTIMIDLLGRFRVYSALHERRTKQNERDGAMEASWKGCNEWTTCLIRLAKFFVEFSHELRGCTVITRAMAARCRAPFALGQRRDRSSRILARAQNFKREEKRASVKWRPICISSSCRHRRSVIFGVRFSRSFMPSRVHRRAWCDPKKRSGRVPNYRIFRTGLQCVKLTRRDRVDRVSRRKFFFSVC